MLQFCLNIFSQTNFTHISFIDDAIQKLVMLLKFILVQDVDKSGYWYLTVVSIGFTGKHWTAHRWSEQFSTPWAVAAAQAIRGLGPWCPHLGSRAGGSRLSGPGTLCKSLAPPAPHTTQGNPPADAPWTVIKVKEKTLWLFGAFQALLCLQKNTFPCILHFVLCHVDCKSHKQSLIQILVLVQQRHTVMHL